MISDQQGEIDARNRRGRNALNWVVGVTTALLVFSGAIFAALWLANAPPFTPMVSVPPVTNMTDSFAVPQLLRSGFTVRVVYRPRDIGVRQLHDVYAESPASGTRVKRGSTVTVYSAVPAKHFHCAGPNGTPCRRSYTVHP